MNVLKLHLQATVATLLARGKSQREIHRLTGVDRKTIRKYERIYRAQQAEADSKSPGMATGSDRQESQIPPSRPPAAVATADASIPGPARSECEPHRAWIEEQVRLKRNAQAIYQDLVDQFGFGARYNSVKRFVRALRRVDPEQFDRLEFAPGEEAQVDYGEGALTRHPSSGRYRRPRLFVMTLRYSRRSYRRVVWSSSQQTWARLHEEAFRYFGGSVSYVVLDNLKEGVITPDLYEPQINRVYGAMLAHYGVLADPTRIRDPNRKGTVENAIQHTQHTALRARRFETWRRKTSFSCTGKRSGQRCVSTAAPSAKSRRCSRRRKAHLRPLPAEPFRTFTEVIRTVWDDTTVRVDNSSYAARPAAIGSTVLVRIYESVIEIRDHKTQALLRTHARATRPGSLVLPEDERPFNPSRQTRYLLSQAEAIGPQTHALCQRLFDTQGRVGQRSMWGVLALADKYPASIFEQACAVALASNVRSSKPLRVIANRLLEQALARLQQAPQGELPLTQEHALIRPAIDYNEFFTHSARANADNPQPPSEESSQ